MKRIFWIVYYSITILANIIAAIVFRERINFNWYSLFPIGYIMLIIFSAFWNPSKYGRQTIHIAWEFKRAFWGWESSNTPKKIDPEIVEANYYETERNFSKVFLASVPIFCIFVFFFSGITKIVAGAIIICVLAWIKGIYEIVYSAKRIREEENAKDDKLRKEQESREAQGKWK